MRTIICVILVGVCALTARAADSVLTAATLEDFRIKLAEFPSPADSMARDAIIHANRHSSDLRIAEAARETDTAADENFQGWGLDAGLSLLLPSGEKPVREAEIRNGIVRVTDYDDASITPILQAHHFWASADKKFGWGPFLALGFGEQNIFKTFSLGAMAGWRTSENDAQSLNLGIGWYIEPDAQFLADDFIDGKPAPENASTIEYKKTSAQGLSITFSYKF